MEIESISFNVTNKNKEINRCENIFPVFIFLKNIIFFLIEAIRIKHFIQTYSFKTVGYPEASSSLSINLLWLYYWWKLINLGKLFALINIVQCYFSWKLLSLPKFLFNLRICEFILNNCFKFLIQMCRKCRLLHYLWSLFCLI